MVGDQGRDEDIVVLLREEHDQARTLLAEIHDAFAPLGDAVAGAAAAFHSLVRLLAVHETAEEAVVYPVLRTQLQAADVVAPRLAEEDEAKRLLARLERMSEAVFGFPAALAEFEAAVLAHAAHEEEHVFPVVRTRISDQQRREMAVAFRDAEARAPTHPHRHAPEGALGNTLLGPFLAAVDHLRDARARRGRR